MYTLADEKGYVGYMTITRSLNEQILRQANQNPRLQAVAGTQKELVRQKIIPNNDLINEVD